MPGITMGISVASAAVGACTGGAEQGLMGKVAGVAAKSGIAAIGAGFTHEDGHGFQWSGANALKAGVTTGVTSSVGAAFGGSDSALTKVGTTAFNTAVNQAGNYALAKYQGEDVSWKTYAKQGGISLAAQVATMGFKTEDPTQDYMSQMTSALVTQGLNHLTGDKSGNIWQSMASVDMTSHLTGALAKKAMGFLMPAADDNRLAKGKSGKDSGKSSTPETPLPQESFFGGLWQGLKNTANWLGELGSSIVSGVKNLPQTLSNIGSSIVNGITSLPQRMSNLINGNGFKTNMQVATEAANNYMSAQDSRYANPPSTWDTIKGGLGAFAAGALGMMGLGGLFGGKPEPEVLETLQLDANAHQQSEEKVDVFTLNVSLNASLAQGSYYQEDITDTGFGLIGEVNNMLGREYKTLQELQDVVKSGELPSEILVDAASTVAAQRGGEQAVNQTAELYGKNMGLATGTLTAVGGVIYDQAGNAQGTTWKNGMVESRIEEMTRDDARNASEYIEAIEEEKRIEEARRKGEPMLLPQPDQHCVGFPKGSSVLVVRSDSYDIDPKELGTNINPERNMGFDGSVSVPYGYKTIAELNYQEDKSFMEKSVMAYGEASLAENNDSNLLGYAGQNSMGYVGSYDENKAIDHPDKALRRLNWNRTINGYDGYSLYSNPETQYLGPFKPYNVLNNFDRSLYLVGKGLAVGESYKNYDEFYSKPTSILMVYENNRGDRKNLMLHNIPNYGYVISNSLTANTFIYQRYTNQYCGTKKYSNK